MRVKRRVVLVFFRTDSLSFDYSLTSYLFKVDKGGDTSAFFIPRKEFPNKTREYFKKHFNHHSDF